MYIVFCIGLCPSYLFRHVNKNMMAELSSFSHHFCTGTNFYYTWILQKTSQIIIKIFNIWYIMVTNYSDCPLSFWCRVLEVSFAPAKDAFISGSLSFFGNNIRAVKDSSGYWNHQGKVIYQAL